MYVLWLCWYLFISHVLLEKYSPSISYIVLSTDSLVLVVFQDRNIIHHWCELMCTTFIILHTTTWCALRVCIIPLLHNTPHNDTGNNSCSGSCQYSTDKSWCYQYWHCWKNDKNCFEHDWHWSPFITHSTSPFTLAASHTCLTIDVGEMQAFCGVISCILASIEQQSYN